MSDARWTPISTGEPVKGIPYSQAALTDDGTLHISGTVPLTGSGELVADDIGRQTTAVLDAVKELVAKAGGSASDIVFVSTHLASASDFDGFNEAYRAAFAEPYPARITVVAGELLGEGVLVESSAVARVPPPRRARDAREA
jgi:2-iminobutanoate/2-iminopropanoate deaminase